LDSPKSFLNMQFGRKCTLYSRGALPSYNNMGPILESIAVIMSNYTP